MKYFSSINSTIYSSKINFVDENNVLVGYDFFGNCCEVFGWYIHHQVSLDRNGNLFDETSTNDSINEYLKGWVFDINFFQEINSEASYDDNNTAIFRLINGDQELFLHLYNIHKIGRAHV